MKLLQSLETEIETAFPMQYLDFNGYRFSYREQGTGPAIIFLHGIGSGSGSWNNQLKGLAAKFRIIAWDAPGYGGTTRLPMKIPDAKHYREALEEFILALDIKPHLLVGHSFGALIGGNYAKSHAELPALVLANPANGYGAADKEIRAEKLSMRLVSMEELGPKGLAAARSSGLLSDNASEGAQALVHWNMRKLNPVGYAQAAHMLTNAHLLGDAPSYLGPVLVMCGNKDTITPEAQCRLVADAYSNSRYKTLLDVGHASYIEDGIQFNKEILTFIREIYG